MWLWLLFGAIDDRQLDVGIGQLTCTCFDYSTYTPPSRALTRERQEVSQGDPLPSSYSLSRV